MRKTVMAILGTLLIAGSAVQMASATESTEQPTQRVHRRHAAASEQFLNANNSSHASASCQGKEAGNPYNEQTDYQGWSSWREAGAWDSHNDCW